jgi:hypothetical protein
MEEAQSMEKKLISRLQNNPINSLLAKEKLLSKGQTFAARPPQLKCQKISASPILSQTEACTGKNTNEDC